MARAGRTCVDCPAVIRTGNRCDNCARQARRTSDQTRGTTKQRGYSGAGHRSFRDAVLARDPICTLCRIAWATVADHHPRSRRELVEAGQDPNDPQHGRGLCKPCHDRETARNQPGGWHAEQIARKDPGGDP